MSAVQLTPKDLKSDQEVRWCPGCGDYAILNSTQAVLAEIGVPREKMTIISGIGCSSRFPYYMGCYGFHSIHGRATAIATGTKTANPDLSVWVVTGDGDAMSIGGNHLIHAMRRNVDLKILMFNNQIYGLTKGQYSPTSPAGLKTKTSPYGSVDLPFNPINLALGSGATFVARTVDTNPKHIKSTLLAAANHKGIAFVEIWQNCVIFNDGAWKDWSTKEARAERTIDLQPGQPLVYGKDNEKGLRISGGEVKVVAAADADVWDPTTAAPLAYIMAYLDEREDLPHALGIFRQHAKPTYDGAVKEQVDFLTAKKGKGDLKKLIYTKDAWQVS